MRSPMIGPVSAEQDGVDAAAGKFRRRLLRPTALLLVGLALVCAAAGLWLADAWNKTAQREAFLPSLEAQARRSPYDGALLALLGGRLAEAQNPQAAETLRRSLACGEQSEVIYQSLAAALAVNGERARALGDLRLGRRSLRGGTPVLDAAQARTEALGPDPAPASLAQAICPGGPVSLVSAYTQGSFLNGSVSWWGRRHPERSGFATRQAWATEEPRDAQAQRLWGLALLANRRLPEAGTVLENAVRLAPRSPAAHLAFAQVLEAGGLMSKAGTEYVTALTLRPNWPPALLGLGRCSLRGGLKYARQAFTRATRFAPDSASAWIGLGQACLRNDADLSESQRAFQTAARLDPARTDFYDDFAEVLRKNGHLDEAEALLRRRIAAAPNDAVSHYRLGGLLMQSSLSPARLAEAERETGAALRLWPHQAGAERQLGTIFLNQGQVAAARRMTEAAIADNPYEVEARHVLAQIYGRAGQPALARQVSAQAARLFALQQQANVLENQKSRRFLDPVYHQDLIRLYRLTGQQDKAAQEGRMAALLRQDPQGAARSYQAYQNSLARALGGAVMN